VLLTVGRNLRIIKSHPQPARGEEETDYRAEIIENILIFPPKIPVTESQIGKTTVEKHGRKII
jgi:hypothetical protein